MPSSPLILLPTSEGKAPGGDGHPWSPGTMAVDLDEHRGRVLNGLVAAMRGDERERSRLLGLKSRTLAAATAADRNVRKSPTMPAFDRYTGALYQALEHGSLPAAARRRASSSLLIVSGLWGLVAPDDPIPDYRLKMGASLPRLGKLSTWWRDHLTRAVDALGKGRIVWDLLPNEHSAAFAESTEVDRIVVRFLERRSDGTLSAVSHWNKPLKGALVRHLLIEPPGDIGDLTSWRHPSGIRLDPSLTQRRARSTTICFVAG